MNTLNRRSFLQSSAAGLAGVSLFSNFFSTGCSAAAGNSSKLGGLTGFAIIDDAARLATAAKLVSPEVEVLLKHDINEGYPANIMFMGALVQGTNKQAIAVIKRAQDDILKEFEGLSTEEIAEARLKRRDNPAKKVEMIERKISLMLGWALASGVRDILIPLYKNEKTESGLPGDMSLYHDMAVLRKKAGLAGLSGASAQEIESLFNGMNPRMIARTHTLTPDYDDGMAWTVRISGWRDDTMKLMKAYAETLVNPDSKMQKKFISDMNFFDEKDKLVKMAGSGNPITKDQVNAACEQAKSIYGRCIASGIEAIQALRV